MRLIEGIIFVSVAAGVHVGIWAASPQPGSAPLGGDGGKATISLEPASANVVEMVSTWQRAPGLMQQITPVALPVPQIEAPAQHAVLTPVPKPVLPQRPALPEQGSLPQVAPPPQPPSPPSTALAKPATPQPPADPRPMARGDTPPQAPQPVQPTEPERFDTPRADTVPPAPRPPSQAQPKAQASGQPVPKAPKGNSAQGQSQTVARGGADTSALQAQWGARIQRKVHRNLVYPRGVSESGTARVALTIDQSGRLRELRLVRSSGVAALDAAALEAVRRAGRFPKAPDALDQISYDFTLGLNFKP